MDLTPQGPQFRSTTEQAAQHITCPECLSENTVEFSLGVCEACVRAILDDLA